MAQFNTIFKKTRISNGVTTILLQATDMACPWGPTSCVFRSPHSTTYVLHLAISCYVVKVLMKACHPPVWFQAIIRAKTDWDWQRPGAVRQCLVLRQSHNWRVSSVHQFDSSPPGQNGRHFADDVFRCIFVTEKYCILIENSLKLIPKGPIDNKPALV